MVDFNPNNEQDLSQELRNRKLTPVEIEQIDEYINEYVDSVSPSEEIMDGIWAVYLFLRNIIESSKTI